MSCDACGGEFQHLRGAIVNGKFGQYCQKCIEGVQRIADPGHAQYSRDKDRDDHEVDLIQPWDSKGTPNREFIRHYPEESKDMFTQEELEQHG